MRSDRFSYKKDLPLLVVVVVYLFFVLLCSGCLVTVLAVVMLPFGGCLVAMYSVSCVAV